MSFKSQLSSFCGLQKFGGGFFWPRFNHLLCNEIHGFFHVRDTSLRMWMLGGKWWTVWGKICWEDLQSVAFYLIWQGEIAMNTSRYVQMQTTGCNGKKCCICNFCVSQKWFKCMEILEARSTQQKKTTELLCWRNKCDVIFPDENYVHPTPCVEKIMEHLHLLGLDRSTWHSNQENPKSRTFLALGICCKIPICWTDLVTCFGSSQFTTWSLFGKG